MSHDKSPEEAEMLRLAEAAKEEAYAPYSGYRVGVCLAAEDGSLFAGCNVENASYPEGSCAETGAIAALVAGGRRQITQVLVVADGERLCTPCGGCRQRLAEFAEADTPVTIYGPEGFRARFALRELLPHAFDLPDEASA